MAMLNSQMVDFRLLGSAKVGFWQTPSIGTHPISDRLAGSTMCFTENIWLKFRRLQLLLHLLPNWQVLALSGNAADMWWGQWGKEAKLTKERAEWRTWHDPLCVCDEINEGFPRFSPFVWSHIFPRIIVAWWSWPRPVCFMGIPDSPRSLDVCILEFWVATMSFNIRFQSLLVR